MEESQEKRVQSLGWEDPLEEVMAIHSSILARRISMDRGAWGATTHRVTKSWTHLKSLSMHARDHWVQDVVLKFFLDFGVDVVLF